MTTPIGPASMVSSVEPKKEVDLVKFTLDTRRAIERACLDHFMSTSYFNDQEELILNGYPEWEGFKNMSDLSLIEYMIGALTD